MSSDIDPVARKKALLVFMEAPTLRFDTPHDFNKKEEKLPLISNIVRIDIYFYTMSNYVVVCIEYNNKIYL